MNRRARVKGKTLSKRVGENYQFYLYSSRNIVSTKLDERSAKNILKYNRDRVFEILITIHDDNDKTISI